jgi:hypothetical protein
LWNLGVESTRRAGDAGESEEKAMATFEELTKRWHNFNGDRPVRVDRAERFAEIKNTIEDAVAPPIDAAKLAAEIVRAAAIRRGEISNLPSLDPHSLAAKILRAGKLRRNEAVDEDAANEDEERDSEEQDAEKAKKKKRKFTSEDEERGDDDDNDADTKAAAARELAKKVINAGRRRRGEPELK